MPTDDSILRNDAVRLGLTANDRAHAIEQGGRALVEIGAVDPDYIRLMHQRERMASTYVGEGIAIPHGTAEARRYIRRADVVILQFPAGLDWSDGDRVHVCFCLAADGSEGIGLLSSVANIALQPALAAQLRAAEDRSTVIALLGEADANTGLT